MDIETIHESLVNGQRKQFVKQVDEYGTYDFWNNYSEYLSSIYPIGGCFVWITDAVISYFRIKGR